MRSPRISVIVPVYKVEKYLKRCVESICSQTYTNLEIILVDDGSPDRCGEMCDELAQQDARIRVLHKKNGGLSSARNAGLDVMTGEYVGFVDSDDWIKPEMYEILLTRMIAEDAQISCCGIARVDGKTVHSYFNPSLGDQFTVDRVDAMSELMFNMRITNSMCDKLFDSDVFDGLRMKEGIIYEDMQIQPYCIHRARRVTYTAKPMYCYFLSQDSILRGEFSAQHYDCIRVSEERMSFLKGCYPEVYPHAKAMHVTICANYVHQSYGSAEWEALRRKLINTVRQPLEKEVVRSMTRNSRIKRMLLCINERLFLFVMNLFANRKKVF